MHTLIAGHHANDARAFTTFGRGGVRHQSDFSRHCDDVSMIEMSCWAASPMQEESRAFKSPREP